MTNAEMLDRLVRECRISGAVRTPETNLALGLLMLAAERDALLAELVENGLR